MRNDMKIINIHYDLGIPDGNCITVTPASYLYRKNKEGHNAFGVAGFNTSEFSYFWLDGVRLVYDYKLNNERTKHHRELLDKFQRGAE